MKRWLLILLLISALGSYLFILGWSGFTFASYVHSDELLHLNRLKPVQVAVGDPVELELNGAGISADTRFSLFMDAANNDALVGSLPLEGIVHDMHLKDDILLVATDGAGLMVLDVSKPLNPKLENSFFRKTPILDIEQDGSRLYLSCGKQGLVICKIGKKFNVHKVASAYWPVTFLESKVRNGYLYVAAGNDGLLVYDLKTALDSGPISQTTFGNSVQEIEFYRNFAFLRGGSGISIIDISNPKTPVLVGNLPAQKMLMGIAIHGDILFVSDYSGVLASYQLTDPAEPSLLGSHIFNSTLGRLKVVGNELFSENNFSGLIVLDINNYSVSGGYRFINLSAPRGLVENHDTLYVASLRHGLKIIKRNSILPRQLAAEIQTGGKVNDLLVSDDQIFIGSESGLLIQNRKVGALIFPEVIHQSVFSLQKADQYLYLAKGNAGLGIVDISDPPALKEIANFPDWQAKSLDVENDYLVFVNHKRLALVSIADKNHPNLLDEVEMSAADVVMSSGIVYVASGQQGLRIYQITPKGKLNFLSGIAPPWPMDQFAAAYKVDVVNGVAYVANGQAGLQLIDVSNPKDPQIISSVDLPGFISGVKVEDGKAYTVSSLEGVQVVDVAQPRQPRLLANIPIRALTKAVYPVGGMLYLGNYTNGISVIPLPRELKDIEYLSGQQVRLKLPPSIAAGRYSLEVNNLRESQTLNGVVTYQ